MTARLPVPGQDNGTWGDVLNEFLSQSLAADGTIKSAAIADKAPLNNPVFTGTVTVPSPVNPTDAATKTYVDTAATTGTPDATTTARGKLQLAGDLAGTATSPQVAKIQGVAISGTPTIGNILTVSTTNGATWADPSAIEVVIYSGNLNAARPAAPAVYWVDFPSSPTNVQSQDIIAAAATPRIISEYSGITSLNTQAYPTSGGKTPTGVTIDIMIAPGAGGGSGRRGAAGTTRCGGGGGAGGGWVRNFYIPASQFGSSWSINIPAAGTGGSTITTDDTNGINGNGASLNCSFQTQYTLVQTTTGDVGYGGTATSGVGSFYSGGGPGGPGSNGVAASVSGGPGSNTIFYAGGPTGGASGGGITNTNVAGNGADGSKNPYYSALGQGTGGLVNGATPTSGTAIAGFPGDSGGSGAASITAAAQPAANSTGYGAGGSGGGASLNGFASGAGGNGGPGFVRLIWEYN